MFNRKLHEMLQQAEQAELKEKELALRREAAMHQWKLQYAVVEHKNNVRRPNTIPLQLANLQNQQLVQKGLKLFNHTVPQRSGKLFGVGRARFEREKLEKEIAALFAKADVPIRVTNIFDIQHAAKQVGLPSGEFDLANVVNGKSREEITQETEDQRIQRKLERIALLFQITGRFHLRKNLYPAGNDITRFVMTEFGLYDYVEVGPMSVVALNKLKAKLPSIASTVMENVHGLIGTMGVRDPDGNDFNLALYVKGGQSPTITNITKAFASPLDHIFPNGRFFLMEKIVIYQQLGILMHELEETFIDHEYLEQLIERVQQQQAKYSWATPLCGILQELIGLVEKGKLEFSQRAIFHKNLGKYQAKIQEENSLLLYKKVIAATLPELNRPIKGVEGEFNRIVSCETGDGARFTPVVDLCLDERLGAGKTAMEMEVLQEMKVFSNLFFPRVSHVMSSASAWINPQCALSDVIEYGDSDLQYAGIQRLDEVKEVKTAEKKKAMPYTREKPEKVRELPFTAFGGKVTLIFSKPITLSALPDDISHERFRKAILLLQKLRLRNPHSVKIYDKFIYLTILKFCEQQIVKYRYDPEVKSVLTAINDIRNEIEANRAALFSPLFAAFAPVIQARESPLWRIFEATQAMLMKEINERAQRKGAVVSTPEERRLTVRWR